MDESLAKEINKKTTVWMYRLMNVVCVVSGFPVGSVKDNPRVILHFDMDCFYAQVEMIRNPGLRSKPVGENFSNVSLSVRSVFETQPLCSGV